MSFRLSLLTRVALFFCIFYTSHTFVHAGDWTSACRQVIAVVTPEWSSSHGRLCTLEKAGEEWVSVGRPFDVTVGRNGLGWGIGLHSSGRSGPEKSEGDKRAPAGLFWLEFGFGTERLTLRSFDYRRTRDSDRWVDDPGSVFYNRWVDLRKVKKDWSSAEVLRRPDGIYDYAIVVGHNRSSTVAGKGSAIFLHSWFGKDVPTIGCTAMSRENVKLLLKWLDRQKSPVLLQVPESELDFLRLPFPVALVRSSL